MNFISIKILVSPEKRRIYSRCHNCVSIFRFLLETIKIIRFFSLSLMDLVSLKIPGKALDLKFVIESYKGQVTCIKFLIGILKTF